MPQALRNPAGSTRRADQVAGPGGPGPRRVGESAGPALPGGQGEPSRPPSSDTYQRLIAHSLRRADCMRACWPERTKTGRHAPGRGGAAVPLTGCAQTTNETAAPLPAAAVPPYRSPAVRNGERDGRTSPAPRRCRRTAHRLCATANVMAARVPRRGAAAVPLTGCAQRRTRRRRGSRTAAPPPYRSPAVATTNETATRVPHRGGAAVPLTGCAQQRTRRPRGSRAAAILPP